MSGDKSGLRRTPSLKRNVRIEVNSSGFSGRVSNLIRQNGANFSAKNLKPPANAFSNQHWNQKYSNFGSLPRVRLERRSLPRLSTKSHSSSGRSPGLNHSLNSSKVVMKVAPAEPFSPFKSNASMNSTPGNDSCATNVADPKRVLAALQELSRSRKRNRHGRRQLEEDEEDEEDEEETSCEEDEEEEEAGSKRARRDSSSSLGSSLSMDVMPPLFSNGVVQSTTSHLVSRETDLSLNSLLSRSQSIFGHHASSATTMASTSSAVVHGSKVFNPNQSQQKRNSNQKTIVNEAQASYASSICLLKRSRPESSSESDSDDNETCNVSIVAPKVYYQKKKRQKLSEKEETTSQSNTKKVTFVDEQSPQEKAKQGVDAGSASTSPASKKVILPSISDLVNTSIVSKSKSPDKPKIDAPEPLILNPKDLEHDRVMNDKKVENLLSAFESEEDKSTKQSNDEPVLKVPQQDAKASAVTTESAEKSTLSTSLGLPASSTGASSGFSFGTSTESPKLPTLDLAKNSNFKFAATDSATTKDDSGKQDSKSPLAVASSAIPTTKLDSISNILSTSSTTGFSVDFKTSTVKTLDSTPITSATVSPTMTPKPAINFSFSSDANKKPTSSPTTASVTPTINFNAPDVTKSANASSFSFGSGLGTTTTTASSTTDGSKPSAPSFSFGSSNSSTASTTLASNTTSFSIQKSISFGSTSQSIPTTTSSNAGKLEKSSSFASSGFGSEGSLKSIASFGSFSQPASTGASTFKFGASTATASPATTTSATSSNQASFTFGMSTTSTTTTASAISTTTPSFNFTSKSGSATEPPKFGFGSNDKPKANSGFSFADSAKKDSSSSGIFTFGTTPSANTFTAPTTTTSASSSSSSTFAFGSNTSKAEPPKQSFSFGSTGNNATSSASNPFQFGASASSSTVSSSTPNAFQFGKSDGGQQPTKSFSFAGSTSTSQTPKSDVFKFGGPTSSSSTPSNFTFGGATKSASTTTFGSEPPAKASASASFPSFGAPSSSTDGKTGGNAGVFTFGSNSSAAPAAPSSSSGVFQFGSTPASGSTPAAAVQPFGQSASLPAFGSTPTNAATPQGGFNFGAAAASPPNFSFGSNAPQPSFGTPAQDSNKLSSGFSFGGAAPSPATPNQFLSQPQATTQQPGGMFSIGSGPSQNPRGRQIARARRTRR